MNIYSKTDRYIEGLLSGSEKAEFEELLKQDPVLAARVKEQEQLHRFIKTRLRYQAEPLGNDERERLGLSLAEERQIDDDLELYYFAAERNNPNAFINGGRARSFNPTPLRRHSIMPLLKAAAAIALLLTISLALLIIVRNSERNKMAQQVYQEFFVPGTDSFLAAIEQKNAAAVTREERKNISPDENFLVLALSYMKNEQNHEAAAVFEELSFRSSGSVSDCALYYNALNLLRLSEYDKALELLDEICLSSPVYGPNACKISERMKKK